MITNGHSTFKVDFANGHSRCRLLSDDNVANFRKQR